MKKGHTEFGQTPSALAILSPLLLGLLVIEVLVDQNDKSNLKDYEVFGSFSGERMIRLTGKDDR